MKKNFRIFTVLIILTAVVFFFDQCNGNKEKNNGKQIDAQKRVDAQHADVKKPKSILPKKLLGIDLTVEQKTKCETLYKEVFTSEILAQRNQLAKKLKGLKKDSEEFIKIKKEFGDLMRPYNAKFNEKLKEILTPQQQDQYFAKK